FFSKETALQCFSKPTVHYFIIWHRDFRLTRQSVALLIRLIRSPRDHGWGQELEVLAFLYSLAHGLSLSVVACAFGMPKSTMHRVIQKVAGEIKAKMGQIFHVVSAGWDKVQCLAGSLALWTDATSGDYLNYKLFYSIQLQAVCDATGRFLDIFVGYPGSDYDAKVLRNSPIYTQALYPPSGFCLLADGGYPCLETPIAIIIPYKMPLHGRVQERYNCHHSRAHSVVERASGVMKARWRASFFFKALEVSLAFAPDIVACCAFLNNLCLTTNDRVELEENVIPDGEVLGQQHPPGGQETSGRHTRDRMADPIMLIRLTTSN
uniref:DDE Tnp4 domain-containing protein n=1 Tax=Acanthochromis polyacanthus TaxID=80966 RepID=A0A3Q1ETY1_9TELE